MESQRVRHDLVTQQQQKVLASWSMGKFTSVLYWPWMQMRGRGRSNSPRHKLPVSYSGANKSWAHIEDRKQSHNQHVHLPEVSSSGSFFSLTTNFRDLPMCRKKWKCFLPLDEIWPVCLLLVKKKKKKKKDGKFPVKIQISVSLCKKDHWACSAHIFVWS